MPAEAKVNRKDKRIIVENVRRVLLKEYLMNETRRAGFGGLDIQRTPMGTRVTLLAERPGLVIGRKGGAIKALTEAVEQKFRFDNPQIEVQEVASPALNAHIMTEKLANATKQARHAARAAGAAAEPIPAPEPMVEMAAVGGPGVEGDSVEEPEPLIVPEEPDPTKKIKKSKVATKRLKKVAKQVSELGVDADVETGGGDET